MDENIIMIVYSEDKEKQYEFLVRTRMTSDILSVQDVIDMLNNLPVPEGRTLSNIPFGIVNEEGKPIILHGDSKKNHLLFMIHKALPVLLDFRNDTGIILSDRSKLYKRLKCLAEENKNLKKKLSTIENIITKHLECLNT